MRAIRNFLNRQQGDLEIEDEDLTLDEQKLEAVIEEQVNDELRSDPDFEVPDLDPLAMKGPDLN